MEEVLLDIISSINASLSNYVLLVLLVGAGLFFTIRTRFVQIRCFFEGWVKLFSSFSFSGGSLSGALTSFQATATALAAQIGTGNIVGACGAVLIGGPGAVFWMWIIVTFGMATNYAEAVLAQKTKIIDKSGETRGGPTYYITKAFKGRTGRILAFFFANALILSCGSIGLMVQSNSISESFTHAFDVPGWIVGLIIALFSLFVFIGSSQRLAAITEKVVPIMAALYGIYSIIVLIMNFEFLPKAIELIFTYAFDPSAGIGGAFYGIVAGITQGAKRGLFSNEAGMGSTPNAHALAKVRDPHDQGVVAMICVYIDGLVVTATALVVISVLYTGNGILAHVYNDASTNKTVSEFVQAEQNLIPDSFSLNSEGELVKPDGTVVLSNSTMDDPAALAAAVGVSKTNMAQLAFNKFMPHNGGGIFICICLLLFAFSTILSWNLFAKQNISYLFRNRSTRIPLLLYSIIAAVLVFLGSVLQNDLVWELMDLFNQLMVIPNILALIVLSSFVAKCAKAQGKKTEELDAIEL